MLFVLRGNDNREAWERSRLRVRVRKLCTRCTTAAHGAAWCKGLCKKHARQQGLIPLHKSRKKGLSRTRKAKGKNPKGRRMSKAPDADLPYISRVDPRSPGVSDMSCTGRATRTVEPHTPVERPATPPQVHASRPPDALATLAQPLIKTTTSRLMEKLGEGSYGKVYRCSWQGLTMAVKIKKSTGYHDREVSILKVLGTEGGHPAVVPLFFWRKRHASGQTWLYFPLFSKDLKEFLITYAKSESAIGYRTVLRLASLLCAGLSFMHSRCVMHRDIKPRNILMHIQKTQPSASRHPLPDAYDWCPVICDFGNACHLVGQAPEMPTRKYCTLQYCAPEVLIPFMKYSWSSDVWSMGLVLAEVEHLHPVAMSSPPAQSNVAQLLTVWNLCQPESGQQPLGTFAARVKRELACYHGGEMLVTMGNGSPHPTLGRVYGAGFANLVIRFLRMDPAERGAVSDLRERCAQR